MKKSTLAVMALAVGLAAAAAAGGVAWYIKQPASAKMEHRKDKYLTLDKVIVMLRREPGDDVSHYLSADLVLVTTEPQEQQTREHLPLLRSIAVKALSANGVNKAAQMTVDQFAAQLKQAFDVAYAATGQNQPFSDVMIGKLIIE